jgi:hypothetical protein
MYIPCETICFRHHQQSRAVIYEGCQVRKLVRFAAGWSNAHCTQHVFDLAGIITRPGDAWKRDCTWIMSGGSIRLECSFGGMLL